MFRTLCQVEPHFSFWGLQRSRDMLSHAVRLVSGKIMTGACGLLAYQRPMQAVFWGFSFSCLTGLRKRKTNKDSWLVSSRVSAHAATCWKAFCGRLVGCRQVWCHYIGQWCQSAAGTSPRPESGLVHFGTFVQFAQFPPQIPPLCAAIDFPYEVERKILRKFDMW